MSGKQLCSMHGRILMQQDDIQEVENNAHSK